MNEPFMTGLPRCGKLIQRGACKRASGHPGYCTVSDPRETSRKFTVKRRAFVIQAKSKPCLDCGIQYHYAAMEFDHRVGADKLFPIARGSEYSHADLVAEMAKCDVVCANCHAMRTWQRLQHGKEELPAAMVATTPPVGGGDIDGGCPSSVVLPRAILEVRPGGPCPVESSLFTPPSDV